MGRQLFLHHYLPAHLASSLVAGALLEFICNVDPNVDGASMSYALSSKSSVAVTNGAIKSESTTVSAGGKKKPVGETAGRMYLSWTVLMAVMAVVVAGYVVYAPLTYGDRGLSVEEVTRRKWPMDYDLHFAK